MLTAKNIKKLLKELNEELAIKNVLGEIGLCGGAVMCLVFKARSSTKDIDAIFEPTKEIREAAKRVAKRHSLSDGWLNDAAKSYFVSDPPRQSVLELSHLRVWAPKAEYMLAMKCVAARFDTADLDDVRFLIDYLELKQRAKVFEIIEQYYPKKIIPSKTQFVIEELMEE
ncbi:MAG: DUF6036 family nucleotidyltransferase [Deltaproteobacteria bacterium]|nr:DUF6036 family nucleotidyltransferase [Deltaproteobacteria bacterium]MDZ4224974.1 hypothetical protein [bacterium]